MLVMKRSAKNRDLLSEERTLLADERTFLSYIRTALTALMSGLTLMHFFKDGILLWLVSWLLIFTGIGFSIWGTFRYLRTRKLIAQL